MRIKTAVAAAQQWLEALLPELNLGDQEVFDVWLNQTHFLDYEFFPLRSAAAMRDESLAMDNCVQRYGRQIVHNHTRIWSVRRDGKRLATVAVGFRYSDPLPMVTRIRGFKNAKVSRELAWVVRRWLNNHDLMQVKERGLKNVPLNRAAWTALWRPYWIAKGRIPQWLPLSPERDALSALDA